MNVAFHEVIVKLMELLNELENVKVIVDVMLIVELVNWLLVIVYLIVMLEITVNCNPEGFFIVLSFDVS